MIVEELIGTDLIKRYSDLNVLIEQIETGDMYPEAVDLRTSPWHYRETDIPIEPPEPEPEPEPEEK